MPTPYTNTYQAAIPGKYARVFVSSLIANPGTLYPVNFSKWNIVPKANDIDTTGFEDGFWENGLAGIVGAEIDLQGPFQVNRAGGTVGAGIQLMYPTALLVYELWLIHPDKSSAYGSLMRFTGVGQVMEYPVGTGTQEHTTFNPRVKPRGRVYLPGEVSPAPATLLSSFTNQLA